MRQELEQFEPASFPIRLTYQGSGDGVMPPPEIPPVGAKPGAYDQETHFSRSTIEDWRIRDTMQRALLVSSDEGAVQEATKLLAEAQEVGVVKELCSVRLTYPHVMPDVIASAQEGVLGNNNERLRTFAFEVYSELEEYFGERRWLDWCIVPYFGAPNDTHQTFQLGVFVSEKALSPHRKQDAGDDYDEGTIEKDLAVEFNSETFAVV